MPGAWLVVRAVVSAETDRAAFDRWYREEHLPDAVKAFHARTAWRGWSETDPTVHYAYYGFDSVEAVAAIQSGPEIKALIAEFDRSWGTKVTRTREVVRVSDEAPA